MWGAASANANGLGGRRAHTPRSTYRFMNTFIIFIIFTYCIHLFAAHVLFYIFITSSGLLAPSWREAIIQYQDALGVEAAKQIAHDGIRRRGERLDAVDELRRPRRS